MMIFWLPLINGWWTSRSTLINFLISFCSLPMKFCFDDSTNLTFGFRFRFWFFIKFCIKGFFLDVSKVSVKKVLQKSSMNLKDFKTRSQNNAPNSNLPFLLHLTNRCKCSTIHRCCSLARKVFASNLEGVNWVKCVARWVIESQISINGNDSRWKKTLITLFIARCCLHSSLMARCSFNFDANCYCLRPNVV